MKYKLLVLDLDGTLASSDHLILPETKDVLMKAQKAGLKVVLASGRPTPGVVPLAEELELAKYGGFILSYNGGHMMDARGDIIHEIYLKPEESHEIYDLAKALGANIMAYHCNDIFTEDYEKYIQMEVDINGMDLNQVEDFKVAVVNNSMKNMMTGEPDHLAEVERVFKERLGHRYSISRSLPYFLEVMPHGINKASCLEKLLNLLGLNRAEMVACGDGYNDIKMIQLAGLGVAMENAVDDLKNVADYVTKSNDDNGIAHVIEKFIL